jgi:hypothetical protein
MQTGTRPDGRELAPPLPWRAHQSHQGQCQRDRGLLDDLPAVKNKVPGPFGPGEKPTGFVLKIEPGEGMKK